MRLLPGFTPQPVDSGLPARRPCYRRILPSPFGGRTGSTYLRTPSVARSAPPHARRVSQNEQRKTPRAHVLRGGSRLRG